ncbi:MAG: RNA polymerase sigma factor [Patescibacteria group bacterium]
MALLEETAELDLSEIADEELFQRSLKMPSLFSIILDRYQDAFLRKAKSVMKTDEGAEDVAQETFTKIYLKGNSFISQGKGSFKSWGYRVLMNTAFTHYQKKKRGNVVEFSEEFAEIFPDTKQMDREEQKVLADYVSSVLVRIPDNFSSVLSKFFLEGKSQEEIAKEEGVSIGSVKTRVYRAKDAFREAMEAPKL